MYGCQLWSGRLTRLDNFAAVRANHSCTNSSLTVDLGQHSPNERGPSVASRVPDKGVSIVLACCPVVARASPDPLME
jgi:hypothetical protein